MRRRQAQAGFSLLELLIVAVALAILAAAACPVYASERSRAEDVLLVANSRNIATPVESSWADVQEAAPTSLEGSVATARQWLAQDLRGSRRVGGDLHVVNPCSGSDAVVDCDHVPAGDRAPAVWVTSNHVFAYGTFIPSDLTVARLRGTIVVDYVVDAQQRDGQIEIYSVDRNGQESSVVQRVPMGS